MPGDKSVEAGSAVVSAHFDVGHRRKTVYNSRVGSCAHTENHLYSAAGLCKQARLIIKRSDTDTTTDEKHPGTFFKITRKALAERGNHTQAITGHISGEHFGSPAHRSHKQLKGAFSAVEN